MHLPDVNVWLALSLSGHVHHAAARDWLEGIRKSDSVFFCRSTQQGLLRLLTTSQVLAPSGNPPLSNREAWEVYERLRADGRIAFATEPSGAETVWQALANQNTASPKLWMDAWLAAFALSAGLRLTTTDRAFSQFPKLNAAILGLQ